MEDNELISKCKNGEKFAFEALIGKYHPLIFKYLCKISGDEVISEDLVQETFIKMIRSIDKFDLKGSAKFYTYLICIAKNCYIDYYRKEKKRSKDISIDDHIGFQAGNNIEELVISKMENMNILEAVNDLTDNQKMVIKMKYIEELTTKEIGDILNIEPKTIKSRVHNAVIKLRKALQGGNVDEGN
jgi:RNA polymerase sigma-70 factor, ECF subfamily